MFSIRQIIYIRLNGINKEKNIIKKTINDFLRITIDIIGLKIKGHIKIIGRYINIKKDKNKKSVSKEERTNITEIIPT